MCNMQLNTVKPCQPLDVLLHFWHYGPVIGSVTYAVYVQLYLALIAREKFNVTDRRAGRLTS